MGRRVPEQTPSQMARSLDLAGLRVAIYLPGRLARQGALLLASAVS